MNKRSNGQGSVRKVEKTFNGKPYKYWEGRVTLKDGRQKSIYAKTAADLTSKMNQTVADVQNNEYFEASSMKLSKWIDEWLEMTEGKVKYNTYKTYKERAEQHIKPALGNIKLRDVTKKDIQQFIDRLQKKDLSPKTVKNVHGVLSICLKTAVELEMIKRNPAENIKLPRIERKPIETLSETQIRAMLQIMKGDEYENILKVILFTGIRESEACGLTWDCISFPDATITIKQQLIDKGNLVYEIAETKSSNIRVLSAPSAVMDILRQVKTEQKYSCLLQGKAFVFTRADGQHFTQKGVYFHYKKNIAPKIGAPYSTVHGLRHTYAVNSLINGDDVKTLQTNLGHATAAFTLDVYGHCTEGMKRESADRMQAFIESVS